MSLFDETPELIRSRALSRMETELQTREGSFSYAMASPLSFELWRVLMTLGELIRIFYVDETSGPWLDEHADLLGLARRTGTVAQAAVVFSGRDGVVIPAGTAFYTESGLQYLLVESVTIADGTGAGVLGAAAVGDAYNTDAGEICQILRNISGLDSFVVAAATGGTDPETDAALFARIDDHRKHPSTSGNENHYREWAMSCDGVGGVKVTGRWNGPGTVRVLISGYDYEPLDDAVVATCAAYIETQRHVCVDVTVLSVGSVALDVSASLTLEAGATAEAVQAAFAAALKSYLQEVAAAYFDDPDTYDYTIYYKRIGALLMCVDGVVDYADLTVNGGVDNVVIGSTSVPEVGEVTLT